MKIKFMLFVLAGGLVLASCSDKEAEQKIADLEKQMKAADSACVAEKTMLMDSIMSLTATIEEMSAPRNTTSSSSSTKTTTSSTPKIGEGKLDFSNSTEKKLKMTSETGNFYPIAVKASRLDFDHGKFKKQNLITDSRNFF